MKIVIQCAGRKKREAGYLKSLDGRRVCFLAYPEYAPENGDIIYARPDDLSDTGRTWRDELLFYNENPGNNPLGLLPAWKLYEDSTYGELAQKYGTENLYILSAGWGLISANFLTPKYNITFSSKGERHVRRNAEDQYKDFSMLSMNKGEPVVFFTCGPYVKQACELTKNYKGPRHLFYNSKNLPDAPNCNLHRYKTNRRTNWHYECAKAFIDGKIGI